jgi:hypothetical protein
MVGFCEHDDAPSGFIRKDISDKLSDNQLSNNILHRGVSK